MSKKATKLISLLLSIIMLAGAMPLSAVAETAGSIIDGYKSDIGYPTGDSDGLILEFSGAGALEVFYAVYGGRKLGGNMLLVDGSYDEAVRYEKMPNIESVTYNYTLEAAGLADDYGAVPDDPDIDTEKRAAKKILVYPKFWSYIAGLGDEAGLTSLYTVRVAVLDTGIDATHEELASRVVAGYDAINDAAIAKGINSDLGADGHGTKVAGIIGAKANNGVGISGTAGAFPVELVPVRVLGTDGKGRIADVVRGIYWALENGADILNMSFGANTGYYPAALAKAISDAKKQNVFSICAGGNDYSAGSTAISSRTYYGFYPADLPDAYPVFAGDYLSARVASYSYKAKSGDKHGIDYTGYEGQQYTTANGGGYTTFTGTSASCAAITGYTAAMFTLLGGRTNSSAIDAAKKMFEAGHGGASSYSQNYHVYNFKSMAYYLNDAKALFLAAIKATRETIQGTVECKSVLKGTAEVTGRITMGAALVADATLAAYDSAGNVLSTSEPVLKTEAGQTEYTFMLDTSAFEDGNITLKIFYRTAAEKAAETDARTVINFSEYTVAVRNSLVVDKMQIYMYDADGYAISASVNVLDPETGKYITSVGSYSSADITISRVLFDQNGGKLTFAYAFEGMLYRVTTAFVPELTLGGEDTAQKTTLRFRGDSVTLAGAEVYTYAGNEFRRYACIGTTDANGELTVCLTDGEYRLIVKDAEKRYLLSVTAVQDGSKTEISFADDINAAREITVSAAAKLGEGDYYSVSLSDSEITSTYDGVALGWFKPENNKIYLSPKAQNLCIGIYDYIAAVSTDSYYMRYYQTAHVLNGFDAAATAEIAFDPTKIITRMELGTNTLKYGDETTVKVGAYDDMGYEIFGGSVMKYADAFTIPSYSGFSGNSEYSMVSSDGAYSSSDSWGQFAPTQGKLGTNSSRAEALPVKEDTYTVSAIYKLNTAYTISGRTCEGYLEYEFIGASETVQVTLGKILTLTPVLPEGATSVNIDTNRMLIKVSHDGRLENATVLATDWATGVVTLSGEELRDGDIVYAPISASGGSGSQVYICSFTYSSAVTEQALTKPDTGFGTLNVTLDGAEIYSFLVGFDIGGTVLGAMLSSGTAVPVGSYIIGGIEKNYSAATTHVFSRRAEVTADGTTVAMTSEEFTKHEMNFTGTGVNINLEPRYFGYAMEHPYDSYYGQPFNRTNPVYTDNTLTELYVALSGSSYSGGIACKVLFPLDSETVTVGALALAAFEATPAQSEYTAAQDVKIELVATVAEGLRVTELYYAEPSDPKAGIVGKNTYYYPTIKYRKAGGDWTEKAFADWTEINLGKLATGDYEAVVSVTGDAASALGEKTSSFAFTVSEAPVSHFVRLNAAEVAADDVTLTVSGTAGATVTVSYTTPGGASKTLHPVMLPESGIYRLSIPLTEYGVYKFTALSKKDGESDVTAEASVESLSSVVAPVESFKATSAEGGKLKLTWNKPAGVAKVWLYRDGEALGYLTSDICEYTDENVGGDRIYTYTIIAENAAGVRSEAATAVGKAAAVADTQKPTAPAAVTAEADGTTIALNWTRSTDNVRVAGYRIYRNGVLIKDTTRRTFTDEGLARGTEYSYCITAYDGAGNESDASMTAKATTASAWNIDKLTVALDRNRDGAIIGTTMGISAVVGAGVDGVTATIVYTTRDDTATEQTATLDLGNAGTSWYGVWNFSRVYEIKSVKVAAYLDGATIAERAAEGFPCGFSADVSVSVTVNNALYAKQTVEKLTLVLKNRTTGSVYVLPVSTESETKLYTFEDLSSGTYGFDVLYDGKPIYSADRISVGVGINKVLAPVTLGNIVRFKAPDGIALFLPWFCNGGLTDDGYLTDANGDSAFMVTADRITAYRAGSQYVGFGGKLYNVPETCGITMGGSREYILPSVTSFPEVEATAVKLKLSVPSGKSLAGLTVKLKNSYGETAVILDANGEATALLPRRDNAYTTVSVDMTELYGATGGLTVAVTKQSRIFIISGETSTVEYTLQEITKENVRLKFTSEAPLEGITVTLSGKGDTKKVKLDASGEVTLPMNATYSGSYYITVSEAFPEGWYVPKQQFSFEGTEYTAVLKAVKTETRRVKLKFSDAFGNTPDGFTVMLSSFVFSEKFTIGEGGMVEAGVLVPAGEKTVTMQFYGGKSGNTYFQSYISAVKTDTEELQEFTLSSTVKLNISLKNPYGKNYRAYVFYRNGETLDMYTQSIYDNVKDNAIAAGAEIFAVPSGIGIYGTAQEQYDTLKKLEYVPSFTVNKANAEKVFEVDVSDIEFYTAGMTDMGGNPVTSQYYIMDGDRAVAGYNASSSAALPRLTSGQRVIIRPQSTYTLSESMKYMDKYCFEWILDDTTPHEKTFTFGYRSSYSFNLIDETGETHENKVFVFFNKENRKYIGSASNGTFTVKDPLDGIGTDVFAAWRGSIDPYMISVYSYWTDICKEDSVAHYELTAESPGEVTLTAKYELLYRIARYTGELDTNIKSVKQQKDGSYLVRLSQNGASNYESVIALPNGAYDIRLDDATSPDSDTEVKLVKGKYSHSITFSISEADLKADNRINCCIITPQGNKSLQYVREIEYDVFSYSMPRQVSASEVQFRTTTEASKTYPMEHYEISVYHLSPVFGARWGYNAASKDNSTSADYSLYDYQHSANSTLGLDGYIENIYTAVEGKWLSFKANADSFEIALNVDGCGVQFNNLLTRMYLTYGSYSSPSKLTGYNPVYSPAKYDEENNCLWISSGTLEKFGMYDRSTGYGYLFIPMSVPESYPHTYKAELKFRYKNGMGETVLLEESQDITMYYDAPVLQKWNFEHYGKNSVQSSPMQYVTITNREDRLAYEKQRPGSRRFTLDWNGTDIFTFYAYFDRPLEVCNVYAVADVPDSCENFAFELKYDETLGCYTGTGILGDALNPPKNYNVVYELVAAQPYNGMPTVQLRDLQKTEQNRKNGQDYELPAGWTVRESAPTNGWTLAETNRAWEQYAALYNSDKPITQENLLPILGEALILYMPLLEIYNSGGTLVGTVQNYYDFSGKTPEMQYNVDMAVMSGGEYVTKITSGASVSEDGKEVTFGIVSDNPLFLLPEAEGLYVSSAGWGTVGKVVGTAVGAYSDYSTLASAADYAASEADAAGWKNSLTPEQRAAYSDYKKSEALRIGVESAMGISGIGAAVTVVGDLVIDTALGGQDIDAQYRKMAQINEQIAKLQAEMEDFRRASERYEPDSLKPQYHIDPSGYIFEGIESNLLEGVTATVYYLDTASGEWVKWDSEAHGEGPNPNISGADGKYGWDVLIGKWKVVFEKDGYYTVESIELDVPPAHLDVNMSMVSTSPATLKSVTAGAMGAYVDFAFDRPVLVDDVKKLVSVMFGGDALDGSIEPLDAALTVFGNKQKPGENDVTVGQNAATKFRFTPDDPIEVGASVTVKGGKGILTYNGLEVTAFESDYVLIPETVADPITALFYDGIEEIEIGATLDLHGRLKITGSEGTLTFRALNPAVATVSTSGIVTAVSGGTAYFEIACGTVRTVAAVSVKDAPHTHSFTGKLPLLKYLACEATCEEAAKYYYFCPCGEVGTETYMHGESLGHGFGSWTLDISDNTCKRTCSVCSVTEEDDSMSLLSVSGRVTRKGDTVTVTVSLANNPGIAALAFRVSYPKGAMTLELAEAGTLFGSSTLNKTTGMFVFDNATDVTENGTLLTLTFRVSDTADLGKYRISVEIVSCNNAAEEDIIVCGGQSDIEVADFISGDVNGDGIVDTKDITRLRRYLAEEDVEIFAGADANGDGRVTTDDLTRLRRYLAEEAVTLGKQ